MRLAHGTVALHPIVWLIAAGKLSLHLLTSAQGYGYFGDELYYLACADHPGFGYVDHPPFSVWALGVWRAAFGDSLFALRALPALIGAAATFFAGALARELGGRGGAQVLTALAVGLAPVHQVVHGFYSMNAWDTLLWIAVAILVVRTLREPSLKMWGALGPALGLPAPIAGHNSFWLWGSGTTAASVVLVMGGERAGVERMAESVEEGPTWDCGHCLPGRNHQTVWIARGLRRSMSELWPELKSYH